MNRQRAQTIIRLIQQMPKRSTFEVHRLSPGHREEWCLECSFSADPLTVGRWIERAGGLMIGVYSETDNPVRKVYFVDGQPEQRA
jgi:hypothetical protein